MPLNKDRIRSRFAGAASTYDHQAVIQLRVAQRLLELLGEDVRRPVRRILEIGCCTGLLTERLPQMFPETKTLYINDLVPEFRNIVTERLNNDHRLAFLPGDIEQLKIPADLDLIVSSSTLHWLEDLPALFKKLNAGLASGGTFCFSIYGSDNLAEIRAITGIGLDYYSIDALKEMVREHFTLIACHEERTALSFADPMAILDHLRETGVNALDTKPWTSSRLNRFQSEYAARFSRQGKVVLTYHPIYCLAQKKEARG